MTLTSQMATASSGIFAIRAMTPATHSRIAIRCVKLEMNFQIIGLPFWLGSTFFPNFRMRSCASDWDKPPAPVPKAW